MKLKPFLLLQLALLGSLVLPASAADLYWNRTTTAAWTTDNWGTVSGGPYTSAWVSGSNVIFEDNGGTALLITGDTTNVSSITANENVTVTASGTLTLAGPINVADEKTLNFQGQVLSGSGIEKTGLGNLDLNASNSFTGGFAIRGGTVFVRNANALGGGSVTLGATSGSDFATLRVPTITFARSIILETGTTGALAIASLGGNATSVYTGGVTGTNNLNIRSVIGGAGTATARFTTGSINHVGSLTLANTGNGTSTSAVGVIDIQSAIGSNVTDLTISNLTTGTRGLQRVFIRSSSNAYTGITTIDDGAILILQNSNVIPDGAGKGNVEVNGTLDMRGATETINGLSGTGTLRIGGAISETTLTVGGNDATASFGGTIENGSGTSVSLTKTGAGTQTLSGTNTYTGETTVTAGTLIINGDQSLATGAVAVNGTSTLGGSGTIAGAVTLAAGANLSPGNSVGTLTFTGGLNISAMASGAGILDLELGPIAASDMIVAGTINIGSGVLNFADFIFSDVGGLQNGTYTLIQSGGITGDLDSDLANLTGTVGTGTGTLQINGNDIELVVSGLGGPTAPYDTWASINAPTGTSGDDFDGDGVSNAIEFVLGGDKDTNDLGKLPVVATTATDMTFSFVRDQDSVDASVGVEIEVSTDLVDWTETYTVGTTSTANVTVTDNLDGTDTITLTVTRAPDDKKFARLKVTIDTP